MATNHGKVEYSPELGEAICDEIAGGGSIKKFCMAKDAPNKGSVFRWLATIPEFRDLYDAARIIQADAWTDEIVDIADKGNDSAKVRNQMNARQWAAERANPQRYQAKMALEHTGTVGLKVEVKQFNFDDDE